MSRTLCVVVAVLGLTSIVAFGQSKPDPNILMGTWKLNVATAKYTPGPAPKSQTLTFKPTATGFSLTIDAVNAQGERRRRTIMGRSTGNRIPSDCKPQPDADHEMGRCVHAHRGQYPRWQGENVENGCHLQRWEDAHHHVERCERARPTDEQHGRLREAVGGESEAVTPVVY